MRKKLQWYGNSLTVIFLAIIDREIYDKVEKVRVSCAKTLGRVRELQTKKEAEFSAGFTMPAVEQVYDDPFEQASSYEVRVEHYTQFTQKNP